jgi:hypothetical protein
MRTPKATEHRATYDKELLQLDLNNLPTDPGLQHRLVRDIVTTIKHREKGRRHEEQSLSTCRPGCRLGHFVGRAYIPTKFDWRTKKAKLRGWAR